MDVYVTVSGKQNEIIQIKHIFFSRPVVYKIQKEKTLFSELKTKGFKKLILTNGYDLPWTFELTD